MGLAEITVASVRRAIVEFDELGREAFLAKYRFGRARDYFLIEGDRRYDSKAIVGAAHGYLGSGRQPLAPDQFSGGEQSVATLLESIGFQVSRPSVTTRRIGKAAMIERIGAKLTNVRWGWDATMPDGSIVFIAWDYRVTRSASGDVEACEIFKFGSPHNEGPGGRERARHVEQLLESGAAGYLVIATPKDQAVHPHEIESVDERLFTVRLEREVEYVRARVVASNSTPDIPERDLASDVQSIIASADIPDTQKPQLVQARRGQGLFRSRVELIEPRCRLTGVTDRAHLRAGHIKPWRDCTNAERLDGNNGLLLAPHVDHLFDRGFISFDDDGRLLISRRLAAEVLTAWGIPTNQEGGAFTAAQRVYLAYHRGTVFLA